MAGRRKPRCAALIYELSSAKNEVCLNKISRNFPVGAVGLCSFIRLTVSLGISSNSIYINLTIMSTTISIDFKKSYKTIKNAQKIYLPGFSVITGENGCGKTQFLEAIKNPEICDVKINGRSIDSIKLITLVEVLHEHKYSTDEEYELGNTSYFVDDYISTWTDFIDEVGRSNDLTKSYAELKNKNIFSRINDNTKRANLERIASLSKSPIIDISKETIKQYASFFVSDSDYYNEKLANLFLLYRKDQLDLIIKQFNLNGNISTCNIDELDFPSILGDPPWEFANKIMARMGLLYEIIPPELSITQKYKLKVRHVPSGDIFGFSDLSLGERTLVGIACLIYDSHISKYDLILLDEPDYSLHPSFSKMMIEILNEVVFNDCEIPIILTTHNIATIANTPLDSLFNFVKKGDLPKKSTSTEAIKWISSKIPNFTVTIESMVPVFVESQYDVVFYEGIFCALSEYHKNFTVKPQFISLYGKKETGSNCTDVIRIVKFLSKTTNTYGIIDYDNSNKERANVLILGGSNRYSIESYLLEPHLVGLLLGISNLIKVEEFKIPEIKKLGDLFLHLRQPNLKNLKNILQKITDYIVSKLSEPEAEKFDSHLVNGVIVEVPNFIRLLRGHDLEEKIVKKFPALRGLKSNNQGDEYLKLEIIKRVVSEFPELLSNDLLKTFQKIKI